MPLQPQGYLSGATPQPGYPAGPTPAAPYGQHARDPFWVDGQPAPAQPGSGQQPSYPPAPGYPPGGYGAPPVSGRPGMITAAAVLAFIWGGFAIIGGLLIVVASSALSAVSAGCQSVTGVDPSTDTACAGVAGDSSLFKIITAGLIIVAILLIWGGVVAITGKNGQLLVIGAAVYILLDIVSVIISLSSSGFGFTGVIGIIAPTLIAIFMLNPKSKAWFRSKGAKTF